MWASGLLRSRGRGAQSERTRLGAGGKCLLRRWRSGARDWSHSLFQCERHAPNGRAERRMAGRADTGQRWPRCPHRREVLMLVRRLLCGLLGGGAVALLLIGCVIEELEFNPELTQPSTVDFASSDLCQRYCRTVAMNC